MKPPDLTEMLFENLSFGYYPRMTKELPSTWVTHDSKVRPYVWSHRVVGIGQTILKWTLIYLLWQNDSFYSLSTSLKMNISSPLLLWLAYFGAVMVIWGIISFPFDLMSYWIERRFHLSKQTIGNWLGDKVKGLVVGSVIGGIVLTVFYLLVLWLGQSWWWAGATFLVLFSILLAQLAPVILIPIFMKLKPMESSPLKQRLLDLCTRHGVEVKEVYHLGLGEKTEKGNAAFVGLGRTKRIMIGDTLYQKFTPEEVEAVFAHELGHQINNDLWKGIGVSTVFIYLTFYLANGYLTRVWGPMNAESPTQLLYFFILMSIIQIPINVAQSAFSRYRERMADNFALEKIGVGRDLGNALERLTFQNFGMFRPNPIWEWLTHSHPAPWRRILRMRTSSGGAA
jgi:STE24 endopeptidase